MKPLSYLSAPILLLSGLLSCSPKIATNVLKNYPPVAERISKQIGIGADISDINGYFTSVKDNNSIPDPSTPAINDKNRLNGSRMNAAIEIQYYIQ